MARLIGPDISTQVAQAATAIQAADAIAIVGAGMSRDVGFPMSTELIPLLWQAIDSDRDGRRLLAARLASVDRPAKHLIGDDRMRVRQAYEALELRAGMRQTFQDSFARLDADRSARTSPAHRALAELLHRGHIAEVISLNWDTMLEIAHEELYGRRLVPNLDPITKPHGDASRPQIPWTLPHQAGLVPEPLLERIQALVDERPRVLLIVGYSERDQAVVDQLIGPLGNRWRVIRVGPESGGALDIAAGANDALPRLAAAIGTTEELPGWAYVHFSPQRGIGPAVLGEGLGPHEVDACPPLPEVSEVWSLLAISGLVTLIGTSGSGKSITAYQAASAEAKGGWEVVRLAYREGSPDPSIAVGAIRHRTIAIVDDAQALPVDVVQRIRERADPSKLRVIVVTTEDAGRGSVVRVASERAVAVVAEALRARAPEVMPLLMALDPTVGHGYLDQSFEHRLDLAARERTPWQFGFVLRGGWQEARSAIAILKEADRADLALAVICAWQLASADGGIDRATLERAVEPLGRSVVWLESSIDLLVHHHRVIGGATLRTPHAAFARTVLEVMLQERTDPERDALVAAVRLSIRGISEPQSFVGVAWIVNALTFAGDLKRLIPPLFDEALVDDLVDRIRQAGNGRDVGSAATALNLLRRWGDTATERIRADPAWIARWMTNADSDSAAGLASLVNDLYNDDPDFARRIAADVDPSQAVARMLEAEPPQLWSWGQFLSRFSLIAPPAGSSTIAESLADPRVGALVARAVGPAMWAASEFIEAIAAFDRPLALRIVERNVVSFARHINASPGEGFRDCLDVLWFVLGFAPRWLVRHRPDREGRRIAARLAERVDASVVAKAISGAVRRDWHDLGSTMFFLLEAKRRAYQAVLDAIDVEALDASLADYWADAGAPLEEALHALGWGKRHEPARTLLARHAGETPKLFARMAMFAADVIADLVRSGRALPLDVAGGHNWDVAAMALVALEAEDRDLTAGIIDADIESIARGLESLEGGEARAAAATMDVVRQLTPDGFGRVLALLDIEKTAARWAGFTKNRRQRSSMEKLMVVLEEDARGAKLGKRFRTLTGARSPRTPSSRAGTKSRRPRDA